MIKRAQAVIPPTKKDKIALRSMIFIGLLSMCFFLNMLLDKNAIGYAPLYWMLIVFIFFICFKILLEWLHYLFITVPADPPREKIYSVDVFTTYCKGEPYAMIEETLTAIQAITYPHTTYLCDEADDPYLKEFCNKLGVKHITRTLKINAKAGNINNALQYATGEICLILDPDHVPFPEFLDSIVDHFNDPAVGFVQVVQSYYNFDDGLIAKGACQQTFQFYGPIMMTMNKYGTVLAIGANCTFRRAALDSIGGHAAGLAEDMHTAMQLHAKGWKSVYVPKVLARGLVPNTLTAYYAQQLKWARGVFELLVTSYPKLFTKFTWLQKLHYAFIPVYYLSGIVFLLNFLIPILSLVTGEIPFKLGMVSFFIIGFPLIMSIILIRHFVQKWVMEEEERGFHVIGGLLMIGTWWVFIVGFVYTIIRKKVPYIPTPKDANEESNWKLQLPNIFLIITTLGAVIFGLFNDWSPYTIIMSGFASLNCLILFVTIYAGMQNKLKPSWKQGDPIGQMVSKYYYYKASFWKFRRRIYAMLRYTATPIVIYLFCIILYLAKTKGIFDTEKVRPIKHVDGMLYSGIFSPIQTNGLPSLASIAALEAKSQMHFSIVSLYLPWGGLAESFLPMGLLDSIYQKKSIPMITWEPWQTLFTKTKSTDTAIIDKKMLFRIKSGAYDAYIDKFSKQIKSLNRPVFLRFAHEADNPSYPWSPSGGNTPEEFIAAWKYVHDFFNSNGVSNVIWVWNPWKPEAVDAYFPGPDYVDWIGVTNLDYSYLNPDKQSYTMDQLYRPFHENPIFQSGIPVMLAEMGTLQKESSQEQWFADAFKNMQTNFPEINAFVLFNSGLDKNSPDITVSENLDWRIAENNWLKQFVPKTATVSTNNLNLLAKESIQVDTSHNNKLAAFNNITGVTYRKGQNWQKNFHSLTKKELVNDFKEIKRTGFNTIKIYGPSIFDHNILQTAKKENLHIQYSFWVPDDYTFLNDQKAMEGFIQKALHTIKELKGNKQILSWNISNTVLQKLNLYYAKPELFKQQENYINWLKQFATEIKKTDAERPLTVDVYADKSLQFITNVLHANIPLIDAFGVIQDEQSTGIEQLVNINAAWFYSKISPEFYLKKAKDAKAVFISNWQDQETKDFVTFDGLNDKFGRNKFELSQLRHYWNGLPKPADFPIVKILLPTVTIFPPSVQQTDLSYHALIFRNNHWEMATDQDPLQFRWELVKYDVYGNPVSMQLLGEGNQVSFRANDYPDNYRLFLYVKNKLGVQIIQSKLNPAIP